MSKHHDENETENHSKRNSADLTQRRVNQRESANKNLNFYQKPHNIIGERTNHLSKVNSFFSDTSNSLLPKIDRFSRCLFSGLPTFNCWSSKIGFFFVRLDRWKIFCWDLLSFRFLRASRMIFPPTWPMTFSSRSNSSKSSEISINLEEKRKEVRRTDRKKKRTNRA